MVLLCANASLSKVRHDQRSTAAQHILRNVDDGVAYPLSCRGCVNLILLYFGEDRVILERNQEVIRVEVCSMKLKALSRNGLRRRRRKGTGMDNTSFVEKIQA